MHSKTKIIGLSLVACLGLVTSVEAGRIGPVYVQGSPSHSSGFGGWNLSNVNVKITDQDYHTVSKTFEPTDGSYSPAMAEGDSFESDIHDSADKSGTVLVHLHGKDWPVGEPSGIKVMNDPDPLKTLSHSKPGSCIMTTSYFDLDPEDDTEGDLSKATPTETLCSSPFQSHKRFKLNMLPSMVEGIAPGEFAKGVNLTFNVEAEVGTRRYTVLQKANNYTGVRLDGYKVEVGFVGADGNFTRVSNAGGADIRLSIGTGEDEGEDIWDADALATFSHGLWGKADGDHFLENGFFGSTAAGYTVELNTTTKDIIYSTGTLGGTYTSLPVPYGDVGTQFGQWLPSEWMPTGIFWDDDNDPATDAKVMAFWGDRGDGNYTWMKGNDVNFVEATPADLFGWASSPIYEVEEIEDVLNLGLNYIVEIGDISTFPADANSKFTIRITPHIALDQAEPGYVNNAHPPLSDFLSSAGRVGVTPAPKFLIGEDLELFVADQDLNNTVNLDVNVSVNGISEMVNLDEVAGRAIFTKILTTVAGATPGILNGVITVTEGTVVTVTYIDDDNGTDTNIPVTVTTTATTEPVIPPGVTPPPSDNDSSKGIFATMDNMSLFAMIFGFLAIGGLIARRKLAK